MATKSRGTAVAKRGRPRKPSPAPQPPETSAEETAFHFRQGSTGFGDAELSFMADLTDVQLLGLMQLVSDKKIAMLAAGRGLGATPVQHPASDMYQRVAASLPYESSQLIGQLLHGVPTIELLNVLAKRGGCVAETAKAQQLVEKKSQDYNQAGGAAKDALTADRDAYFPFGSLSHVQMIHVKAQRAVSLVMKKDGANYEGLLDTAHDLINYASFLADWLRREADARGMLGFEDKAADGGTAK